VLAKHKHCKQIPEALSVAIKHVGLELNVKKPKRMRKKINQQNAQINSGLIYY